MQPIIRKENDIRAWGVSLSSKKRNDSNWAEYPNIEGHNVVLIDDMRSAPGGEIWKGNEYRFNGTELSIKVYAAATDIFTLYFERDSLNPNSLKWNAGMHLERINPDNNPLQWSLVKFQLPFVERTHDLYVQVLIPAKFCPLERVIDHKEAEIELIEARKERTDHYYTIQEVSLQNQQLRLKITHPMSINTFKIECEKTVSQFKLRDPSYYKMELFGFKDHEIIDCTCRRKDWVISTVTIDLSTLPRFVEKINLWGPNDTSYSTGTLDFNIPQERERFLASENLKKKDSAAPRHL